VPRMDRIKPPALPAGATIAVVAPASPPQTRSEIEQATAYFEGRGHTVVFGPNHRKVHGYLAGTDAERAADLQWALSEPGIDMVHTLAGGYGTARLYGLVDWEALGDPRIVCGFSDITALHLAIAARAGFPTIHGPNAGASWGRLSWDAFRALAFEGATPTFRNPEIQQDRLVQRAGRTQTLRPGKASGPLLGGNLTVLTALMGTPYLPSFDGAILFLEDVEEAEYRIDRMLTQLALSGVLARVAGVVFGQCTRCTGAGPSYGGFTLTEVLDQHLSRLGVPAFSGLLVGHISEQFSLPVGVRAEMDAEAGTIRMLEPTVV
jgi:muramoyltetrapeptide carboxypeptidase